MLDEPTSGLDSHTSERIVKLMRAEANRGGTVLATIHQPSGTIFQLFDRIIILSEGYLIYNGPPELASFYFNQFGMKIPQFSNPADKLAIAAA